MDQAILHTQHLINRIGLPIFLAGVLFFVILGNTLSYPIKKYFKERQAKRYAAVLAEKGKKHE